ncbi:hypothetical protein [Enhydrobacter sp.]|jgi:hypothetical protein|uniref:hypothetical protein n=1 Tax=Enhydrobacter sp. TaxID=1894999 RepID=UPI00262D676D|nr:hypothetical protein [Enhydrobacter sp.]WIM10689.1 MAG: hypothetical protein OJF58_001645 [Enhydrobacter sp.]
MLGDDGDAVNAGFIGRIDAVADGRSAETAAAIAADYHMVAQAKLIAGVWQSPYAEATRRKLIMALDGRVRDYGRCRDAYLVYRDAARFLEAQPFPAPKPDRESR